MFEKGGKKFRKIKIFLIPALIATGFFCVSKKEIAAVGGQTILISEIQTGGAIANDEFVELYNTTASDIDLSDYSIQYRGGSAATYYKKNFVAGNIIPGYGFFLVAHSDYSGSVQSNMSHSSFQLSGNGGTVFIVNNQIILTSDTDSGATVVDRVAYGIGDGIRPEGIFPAIKPESNQSIARKITSGIMQDTDDNNLDFNLPGMPDPQNTVSAKLIPDVIPPPDEPPPQTSTSTPEDNINIGESGGSLVQTYNLGNLVINEFVSDPADGEEEWIEIFNTTGQTIDLNGWTIEEGSGAKTNLSGEIGASGESKFFIVANPSGNLNNSGDIIILRDNTGKLIDQVAYGSWDDGDKNNNAPKADDPLSVARKFDGYNSYNNLNDFAITSSLTKNQSNMITDESENDNLESGNFDYSNDIIISEIFPNPKGDDSAGEFIELYNKGVRDVNLLGWALGDESAKKYEIANSNELEANGTNNIIKAQSYFVIYRSESKIVLNNTSDSAKLYQPLKDESLLTVKYEKTIENWSYNYAQDGKWQWSEIVTPGKANEIKTVNHAPVVDFDCPEEILIGSPVVFDTSDTIDEDCDILSFNWDFGDGIKSNLASPEHTFLKTGAYNIKLEVSDGQEKITKEKIARAVNYMGEIFLSESNIIINEFCPSPEGSDEESEWIEIYNKGQGSINLFNWKLADKSKFFKFQNDIWLKEGTFYLLERPESNLALNNNGDAIRLYNNLEELVDEIEYGAAIEGESFARGQDGKWFWTTVLTPGEENVIFEVGNNNKTIKQKSNKTKRSNNFYVKTTLEKIKEFEAGDLIDVSGIVAVLPGIFGVQYFYIVGSPGIQVYNYKKDFPDLKVGDYIEVKGELSMVNGEARLKTKTAGDIKFIEHKDEPSAEEITSDKLNDDYAGRLVKITGEITEKKGAIIYLDDGLGEAIIQIKRNTGISSGDFSEGEAVSITGIASRSSSGLKILPRSPADITRENDTGEVEVLGVSSATDEWALVGRKKKVLYYILIALGGAVIIGGVAWWRRRNPSPL